jgi:hypothetical protein
MDSNYVSIWIFGKRRPERRGVPLYCKNSPKAQEDQEVNIVVLGSSPYFNTKAEIIFVLPSFTDEQPDELTFSLLQWQKQALNRVVSVEKRLFILG